MVLAQHGDVRYHVHGRDVGGEDHRAGRRGSVRGCAGCGGFAQRFDDFFDAAFEGFVFVGCQGGFCGLVLYCLLKRERIGEEGGVW